MRKILFLALLCLPMMAFSQWQLVHTFPMAPEHIYAVGNKIYVSSFNRLYSSADDGATWGEVSSLPDTFIRDFYADADVLMTTSVARVYVSTDGGSSWTTGGPNFNQSGVFAVGKAGNNLLCGTFGTFANDSATLNLSIDNGVSWTEQVRITNYSGFPAFATKDSFVVASSYSSEFYYSTDYGVNYTPVFTPFASESMVVTNSSIVAAALEGINNIKYSTDNGQSWYVGKDTVSAQDLKNRGDTVYAATLQGFYYSYDAGMSWQVNNTGLPTEKKCYAVATKGNDLWLAHHSGGIYRMSLQGQGVNEQNNITGEFSLFPNPASKFVAIQAGGKLVDKMEVYNLVGEKLMEIKDPAGKIYIGDLAKGIYIVRLYQNERFQAKKLVVQ